jgi:ribonuclease HI
MPKNNFYVVWKGRKTGIFDSWAECREQIIGFEGAQYKGYPSLDEAKASHLKSYWEAVGAAKRDLKQKLSLNPDETPDTKPIIPSVSVDAACGGNPGKMEYRGVWTATGEEIFRMGPFDEATNNIGEFLAVVHALALLKKNNSDLPVYSDSINAMSWVRKKHCNTRLAQTFRNTEVFNLIARAENWLLNNSYSNPVYKWRTDIWGEIPADFGRK